MRLIDADALDYELGSSDRDIYVRECLQDAPTVTTEYFWIPCKEQLPKQSGKYLVWAVIECVPDHVDDPNTFNGVEIAFYVIKGNGGVWFGNHVQKVVAWMPLPKVFKENEHESN